MKQYPAEFKIIRHLANGVLVEDTTFCKFKVTYATFFPVPSDCSMIGPFLDQFGATGGGMQKKRL